MESSNSKEKKDHGQVQELNLQELEVVGGGSEVLNNPLYEESSVVSNPLYEGVHQSPLY